MSDEMDYCVLPPGYATDLNAAIIKMMRPAGNYTTTKYCKQIAHPNNGLEALVMPRDTSVPVHAVETCDELFALFDQMVEDGAIEANEAEDLKNKIIDSVGETISPVDLIPPSERNILTHDQMNEMNWFPELGEVE